MKASSLITALRYQLADLEALGFSDALLIDYINDGLCLIYDLKPEAFAASRVLKALCGDVQTLDGCCDRLLSVDAISTPSGLWVDMIRQGSVKMAREFDKTPAGTPARTYSLRENVYDEFTVWPPVAPGECVYFRITCTEPPAPVGALSDDVPECRHHEALMQYVLFRAYQTESESVTSQTLSGQCFERFMSLLGVERQTVNAVRENNDRPNEP